VLLTTGPENPNAAALRMYVEGAEVDLDRTSASYKRVLLVFDGRDDDELAAARRQWSRLKSDGFALAYWQQSDEGRWERKM
jgi:DNA polymerase-3 subunit chi